MTTQAIIFDKDGTLIDFDAFWVAVSIKAIEEVLERVDADRALRDTILEAFGVHDGVTDLNGILCKGTYEQMGEIVYGILQENGCALPCDEVVQLVLDAYNRHSDAGEVKPTCPELADVLTDLKTCGMKLAVVTTDNRQITDLCLAKLGIADLFDYIYTDDGDAPTTPDPACAVDFCRRAGVEKSEKTGVMVGDTMTDMRFAHNSGITAVALARSEQSRAVLTPHADAVISAMTQLKAVIGLE